MSERTLQAKNITWHHFATATDADLESLQGRFKFHHLDYEDIRTDTPISKMDIYKHYIFFVFHFPTWRKESEHVFGQEFCVFLSNDVLVTIGKEPYEAIETFFDHVEKSSKFRASLMGQGTSHLLYRLLMEAFRGSMQIVKELTKKVSQLEDAIEHRYEKRLTVDLGHVRRNTLFLRHIVDPQRNMLSTLSTTKRFFFQDEQAIYFDDLKDVLDSLSLTAENLKHIIDGLFDINETLLSHKTNEVVTLLTIISAALMVPTLISGFYGMNVSWLPFVSQPHIVASFFALGLLGIITIVILILRISRD